MSGASGGSTHAPIRCLYVSHFFVRGDALQALQALLSSFRPTSAAVCPGVVWKLEWLCLMMSDACGLPRLELLPC